MDATRELTPAQRENLNEGARSYLVPAASPAQQANGIALMLAELKANGLPLTASELFDALDEENRERLRPVLPLLTPRRIGRGRRRLRLLEAAESGARAGAAPLGDLLSLDDLPAALHVGLRERVEGQPQEARREPRSAVRRTTAPTRGDPSGSAPSSTWPHLAVASRRMLEHVRRREAKRAIA